MFDWDGTLVDTLETKIRNAGALFEEVFGINPESVEAAYRQHSGLPRRRLFEAILQDLNLPDLHDDTYQILSQGFTEKNQAALTPSNREQLVPQDTLFALEALSQRGFPLFVSSSAEPGEVRQIARDLDLDHYFVAILGSQPGFSKGRDHVNYVLTKINASPSKIVFVGDEPADVLLGREAGVLTVAKAGTYPPERLSDEGADAVVGSLGELVAWLDQREFLEE